MSAEKPTISGRLGGMKFMQRAKEAELRRRLEREREQSAQAAQWVNLPTPSPETLAYSAGNTFGVLAEASEQEQELAAQRQLQQQTKKQAAGSHAAAKPAKPVVVLDPQAAPFVPGRRSYGQFNPQLERVVERAKANIVDSDSDSEEDPAAESKPLSSRMRISQGGGGGGRGGALRTPRGKSGGSAPRNGRLSGSKRRSPSARHGGSGGGEDDDGAWDDGDEQPRSAKKRKDHGSASKKPKHQQQSQHRSPASSPREGQPQKTKQFLKPSNNDLL